MKYSRNHYLPTFNKPNYEKVIFFYTTAESTLSFDFVFLADRETFRQRIAGMRGKRVIEEVKQEKLKHFLTGSGRSLTKK